MLGRHVACRRARADGGNAVRPSLAPRRASRIADLVPAVERFHGDSYRLGEYSHARLHDLQGALDSLPDLTPKEPERQTKRATGTDGGRADGRWAHWWAQSDGKKGLETAKHGEGHRTETEDKKGTTDSDSDGPNVLKLHDLATKKPPLASGGEKRRARDSNPQPHTGQLISNQPRADVRR